MRVLVACEESGVVRDAFARRGHDAWSCDILPRPGKHITGDVLHLFDKYGCPNCNGDGCERCAPWDLMIAFPPCTHLAVSGAKHFARKADKQAQAVEFVRQLLAAPVPRIAIENPVGVLSTRIRKPDQIIQPWQFGHEATKTTCLWLVNLPPLVPTRIVGRGEFIVTSGGKRLPKWYSDARRKRGVRSRTFAGVASAMADQWGSLAERKSA